MSRTLVLRPRTRRQKTREILHRERDCSREARRTQRHILRVVMRCLARGYGE